MAKMSFWASGLPPAPPPLSEVRGGGICVGNLGSPKSGCNKKNLTVTKRSQLFVPILFLSTVIPVDGISPSYYISYDYEAENENFK
jgi:hypothetical protein